MQLPKIEIKKGVKIDPIDKKKKRVHSPTQREKKRDPLQIYMEPEKEPDLLDVYRKNVDKRKYSD